MTDPDQCELLVNFESRKLDLIKRAAIICDQPVSEFIVDAAFNKAVGTILTDKVTFMSDEAYQAVCRTILNSHASDRG